MKKILYLVAITTVLFTACTNEALLEEEKLGEKQVTITAYTPSGNPDARVAISGKTDEGDYTLSWINGDKISIIRDGVNNTYTKDAQSTNTFTGNEFTEGEGTYYAAYPAVAVTTDHTKVPFDISQGISGGNIPMYASSEDGQEFQFHHAMAYLQLSFTDGPETCDELIVSVPFKNYTSGTMDLTQNGTIAKNNDSKCTITFSDVYLSEGTVFFAIPPMSATNKTLKVKVKKDGDTYMGTLNRSNTDAIEAGKYYTATVALEKVVPVAVDLGLSVKWATFNVGATKPEEYGEYFAWGETEPKAAYSQGNYILETAGSLTKYNDDDKLTNLQSEDDAATVNWGEDWRMPTKSEWEELLDETKCSWEKVTIDGVTCFKVVSKVEGYKDNFIILSAGGYKGETYDSSKSEASYWSSTRWESTQSYEYNYAGCFEYASSSDKSVSGTNRYNGHTIRPVYVEKSESESN